MIHSFVDILLHSTLVVALSSTAPVAHEYHVATTTINYDEKTRAFQIVVHAFIDDLEAALRERGHDRLFLGTERETPEAETYLRNYLDANFALDTGDDALRWQWVGHETSEDLNALYIYLEVPDVDLPPAMNVEMPLLTEIYDDQRNMIHVTGPDGLAGYLLLYREYDRETIKFTE